MNFSVTPFPKPAFGFEATGQVWLAMVLVPSPPTLVLRLMLFHVFPYIMIDEDR